MNSSQNKALDPRLRRIFRTKDDTARLRNDLARSVVSGSMDAVRPEEVSKSVLVMLTGDEVPSAFANHRWSKIVDHIYSAEIPVSRLAELAGEPTIKFVEAGLELSPSLSSSIPETRTHLVHNPPLGTGFNGSGIIVGIIDFGLDFTLDDFRNMDGTTRVAFLWDQSLRPQGNETSPDKFPFGVEYDSDAINQALQAPAPFAVVRHDPGPGSHGTHVASTAAGNGRSGDNQFPSGQFVGAAPGSTIIFVQPAATDQTTTFTDSVRVAEAISYIFQKADELGRPCVINMSLGQNGGSHDGESIVERAIDRLLEQPGRAFVVAAGNEHVWRGHASATLNTGQTRQLRWKVGGELPLPGGNLPPGFGDFTPNEMEIWYSSRDRWRVRVLDPQANTTNWVEPGESFLDDLNGDRIFIDSERFTSLNGDARIYIEISPQTGSPTLQTGVWQVEIEAIESRNGRFDAWIERDARRQNNRFADQSFFVGTDFDEIMTLGTPATTRRGIAVANYDHVAQSPNDSSGRGRTRDGRDKPEVAAPGTDILAANSLGGRSDFQGGILPMRIPMSGTSMAAPHVAGIVALLLQKNSRLTSEQIISVLVTSANPPLGVLPFDLAWGYGRVDAQAAVALVDTGPSNRLAEALRQKPDSIEVLNNGLRIDGVFMPIRSNSG